METLILPAVHLGLLLGFLVYKTKRPFREFMSQRHADVKTGLERSQNQVLEAEAKKKEVEKKLAQFDALRSEIEQEWKKKSEALIQEVRSNSTRTQKLARSDAAQLSGTVEAGIRTQILETLVMKVSKAAEVKVTSRLTPDLQSKLQKDFVSKVGA